MFRQVRVEILGMIENMSYLICPHCDKRVDVFSTGGGKRTAEEMEVHFLGELPLDPEVRAGGDSGRPIALQAGKGDAYVQLAKDTIARIAQVGSPKGPTMKIED
jgi:ATP-binding protein involved in chromosome partitioning